MKTLRTVYLDIFRLQAIVYRKFLQHPKLGVLYFYCAIARRQNAILSAYYSPSKQPELHTNANESPLGSQHLLQAPGPMQKIATIPTKTIVASVAAL